MTRSSAVAFAPGTRSACVRGHIWVLVDRPVTDALVLRVWGHVGNAAGVEEIVDALLHEGLLASADFALAVAGDGEDTVRIVVRGELAVSGEDDAGTFETRARGILIDEVRSGVRLLSLHGAEGSTVGTVPVVEGVLPAEAVTVSLAPVGAVPVAAPADHGVDAEPSPEPEPEPEPETEPEPEPEADAERERASAPAPAGVEASPDDDAVSSTAYAFLFESPAAEVEEPASPLVTSPAVNQADDASTDEPQTEPAEEEVLDAESTDTATEAAQESLDEPAQQSGRPPALGGGLIESIPDFFGTGAATAALEPSSRPATSSAPTAPHSSASEAAPAATDPAATNPAVQPAVGGRTVNRAHLAAAGNTGPTVYAAWCPNGHPTPAYAGTCRVCGQPVAEQSPQEIPRPVLGRLVLPIGDPVALVCDLILGRDPSLPPGGGTPPPRLVVLNDPRHEVSSQHAEITLNFWEVRLTDLGSTNGTEIITPDGRRQRLTPHSSVAVVPGTRIILAEVFEMIFEAAP